MKKRILPAVLAASLLLSASGCSAQPAQSGSNGARAVEAEPVRVVLDWTPNTNHTGLYAALEQGYYKEAGLDVEIIQPPEDGAPALVAAGGADFGIAFQDTLAPAFALDSPLPVTAVAAVLQHNTSGIVSKKGNGIDRPKGMEGKTYATWNSPVEKAMVNHVVKKDGGDPDAVKMVPSTVTDVVTALQTNVDAVWIFYAWDGIATKVKGLETDYFEFRDIDPVFDYYTPVLIAGNTFLEMNPETAKKFLAATQKGYDYASQNPEQAAEILLKAAPELDRELVMESQKWIANQYTAEAKQWGIIDPARWDGFYAWLNANGLVEEEIPAGTGFSNAYLPQ